jgi:plastocyanin
MRVSRVFGVLVALLAVAVVGFAVGCGDDDDENTGAATTTSAPAAETGGGTTEVAMTEFKFDPNDLDVSAGDTLTLNNDGQIPHNLTIVEGDNPLGGGAELAASDDVSPGDSGDLTVDVEPGTYSFLCTIPGHAEDGMTGSITVK